MNRIIKIIKLLLSLILSFGGVGWGVDVGIHYTPSFANGQNLLFEVLLFAKCRKFTGTLYFLILCPVYRHQLTVITLWIDPSLFLGNPL